MTAAAAKLPTFEELYAEIERLPEGMTGEILEPGTIETMSRPGKAHRHASKRATMALSGFDVGQSGAGWWIEVEIEIRFGPRLLVPDLAGWRVERMPDMPEDNPIAVVPDWTCEILSPSTARKDRGIKLPHYARSGVPWIWLVDPALHTIEVYETDKGRPALAMTAAEADVATLPPFDGEIAVAAWWLPAVPTVTPPPPPVAPARGLRSTRAKRAKR